jgi:hypothetical protein
MTRCKFAVPLFVLGTACVTSIGVGAQPITLPDLEECRNTHVDGLTSGTWESRRDAQHSGRFQVTMDLGCSGDTAEVRVSNLEIHAQELADNDPGIDQVISADGAVRLFSIGEAMTPIMFISGACRGGGPNGCQFWLMLADNGSDRAKAPDLVAFLVSDRSGKRLAYGTGPIQQGDISIQARH